MTLLLVENLAKGFGGVCAVDNVSFRLEAGELLAMIGPNGAGKSTCFNMVNGQLRPDAGRVLLDGKNIVGLPPHDIWRMGVGRTFQIAATFGSMTAVENVQMALISREGLLYRMWRRADRHAREEAMSLLERVGMADQAERPCGILAYGDVKRIELAIALANRPKVLLMDEPTAGMAPKERIALMALTRDLAHENGIGVLFTEHSMDVVFGYADKLIVLARGKMIAEGDRDSVRDNPRVREVYFGAGKTAGLHA
ncbi:MAG: ABC transporter ATP-binding protein [Hyphomicrobiales bacterium]|nr:ABC transporter ATP-binding protein [Hyphomicrobiales bacterium]